MSKVMVQLRCAGDAPSLDEAARALGLEPGELDPEFGVIPTDPQRGLFAVRCEAAAAERAATALEARGKSEAEGVYGDVRIAPFGPPRA